MDLNLLYLTVLAYLIVTLYLGYRGWKATKSAEDYMVAGRKIHPWIMALSYGATFISTSARESSSYSRSRSACSPMMPTLTAAT